MLQEIARESSIVIKQRKEMIELLGFETRNKYEILNPSGLSLGFAAEQQKGFFGTLLRQIVGHWRSFDIHVFDSNRQEQFVAHHPFRFYFQRLEVRDMQAAPLGHLERQFSILTKKFLVYDENSRISSEMASGLFKIWTFPFKRNGVEIAKISKKWGGAMTEIFLDSDTFLLEFLDPQLTPREKVVLLCSAIFIDLLYFENNQGKAFTVGDLIPS